MVMERHISPEVAARDRLDQALKGLRGVLDLLCQVGTRDLHLVDPDHLYFLLLHPVQAAEDAAGDLKAAPACARAACNGTWRRAGAVSPTFGSAP
jgi:hypothetical protein